MSKFNVETLAVINSKEKEQVAASNERMAVSAFRTQIAGLQARVVDFENELESANSAFKTAVTPGTAITDRTSYIRGISSAIERQRVAVENLANAQRDLNAFVSINAEYFYTTTEVAD